MITWTIRPHTLLSPLSALTYNYNSTQQIKLRFARSTMTTLYGFLFLPASHPGTPWHNSAIPSGLAIRRHIIKRLQTGFGLPCTLMIHNIRLLGPIVMGVGSLHSYLSVIVYFLAPIGMAPSSKPRSVTPAIFISLYVRRMAFLSASVLLHAGHDVDASCAGGRAGYGLIDLLVGDREGCRLAPRWGGGIRRGGFEADVELSCDGKGI